jgi:tyrosine-protein phosphatase YwqE
MTGFTIAGNVVSYQGTPMAQLEGVELALDNNKMVREMTFSLMENADMSKVANMIAFLHEKHPDYEIEVEIDVEKVKELK